MNPMEQAKLPFTRIVLDIHERTARHGLSLLDEAVDAYHGEHVSMNVSTMQTSHQVRTNSCYVVRYADDDGNVVHATVVADELLYIAQNPLPRTSYGQTLWVRDLVRLVLDAPDGEPAPGMKRMTELVKAYELIDQTGSIQDANMKIERTGANPLGTGGIHVCLLDQKLSLSDHDETSIVPGPIRVDVVQNQNTGGRSTTTTMRIEAHGHATSVPAADAIERLRLMRKAATEPEAVS